MSKTIHINAVAFKGEHAWVVQGIEYDIVAYTDDVSRVPEAFMRAVAENAAISEHLGRKGLEGISPAPESYRAMFEAANTEVRSLNPSKAPSLSVRVAESAQAA